MPTPTGIQSIQSVPGITLRTADTNSKTAPPISWRKASLRKVGQAIGDTGTISASVQLFNRVMEGSGYLESIDLELVVTTSGNAATVAFQPDAPWIGFSSLIFKDVSSDTHNYDGYAGYLVNLYTGNGDKNLAASADSNVYQAVTGSGGTGGSIRISTRVPLAINNRSLMCSLGNQDRGVKYEVRSDVNTTATLYSTAPTTPGTFVINRTLNFTTVPPASNNDGQPQEIVPRWYGAVRQIFKLRSEAAPVSASTVNHFLRSIGNTIRTVIMIQRDSTGGRPTTDNMVPSKITLRVGDDTVFSESGAHRRQLMYKQYNFDAPVGVLVYTFATDFSQFAGFELGDDLFNTFNVPNAQYEITYPTFANTPGTLDVVTDSIIVPQGVDILSNM